MVSRLALEHRLDLFSRETSSEPKAHEGSQRSPGARLVQGPRAHLVGDDLGRGSDVGGEGVVHIAAVRTCSARTLPKPT